MKTVLFVHGNPPLKLIKKMIKGFSGENLLIVALDIQTSLALNSAGVKHKTSGEYPVRDSEKRAVDFLNAWSCKKILGSRNIRDLLVHDDFSFWWCLDFWLFYSFVYRDPLNRIVNALDVVNSVIDAEHPEKVAYINDNTLFSKVIPLLSKKAGASATSIKRSLPATKRFSEYMTPWAIKQFFRWHTRARKLVWRIERFRANYSPPKKKGKNIFAVCAYHWRNVEHPVLSKPMLGDPYVTPVVEQFKDDNVTYVDCTQREYVGFSSLKSKAHSSQNHILLEKYLSWGVMRQAKKAVLALQKTARELAQSLQFKNSWNFEGIDIWPLIAPQFFCYFKHRLEGHVVDYYCVKEMISREKPDMVIFPGEGGDLAYVFFKICADSGIPCVGIQHGTIPYNPTTVHAKEAVCSTGSSSLPRPNKLLLYGSYYLKFLAKNAHYPEKNMVVVGNLRFDHFINAKKLLRKDMALKYGLDPERKIMLYATQIMPSPQEGIEITKSVFNAAKELNLPLIVKQHPGELSDSEYRSLANKMGIKPLITSTASTLELITASDIMIGSESTLDYEAMILGKPVIVINLSEGRKNWLPFVDEEAALGVYKKDHVVLAVKKALFDQKTSNRLAKGMKKIIREHCYKIDGKAAERAAEIIRGLIK